MWIRNWLALIICLGPLPAQAAPSFVSIEEVPGFADAPAQLQVLANANGHRTTNRFCVIGQKDGRYVQAYVSWPAEDALILWVPHLYDTRALVTSKRYWHLKRDVVAGDDVHGSTYLLTRSVVNDVLAACRHHGENFVVKRSTTTGAAHG